MADKESPTASRLSNRIFEGTLSEIASEKAASLGRAGRRLENALAALAGLDKEGSEHTPSALIEEASDALWHYVVQREACGLRGTEQLMREMKIPREVQLRMGIGRRR